jgi:hypothetical protein
MKDSLRSLIVDPIARPGGGIRAGLSELANAYRYSIEIGVDIWIFAVEIQTLRACGLTNNDLRYLICKGYVDHAGEVKQIGQEERSFVGTGRFHFSRRTCFIITDAGMSFLQTTQTRTNEETTTLHDLVMSRSPQSDSERVHSFVDPSRPRWDPNRQELLLGRQVVKQFKVPAPNQEIVLSAFEEEGWPPRMDDPIPPHHEIDPKRRLHDTINSLNHCQKTALLRFLGDGSGKGIRWEIDNDLTGGTLAKRRIGMARNATNGQR